MKPTEEDRTQKFSTDQGTQCLLFLSNIASVSTCSERHKSGGGANVVGKEEAKQHASFIEQKVA